MVSLRSMSRYQSSWKVEPLDYVRQRLIPLNWPMCEHTVIQVTFEWHSGAWFRNYCWALSWENISLGFPESGCAGWSAPVLFAKPCWQVFSHFSPYNDLQKHTHMIREKGPRRRNKSAEKMYKSSQIQSTVFLEIRNCRVVTCLCQNSTNMFISNNHLCY